MKQQKLTIANKIGYGLSGIAGAMNSIIAAFLTMFYTDNIGMAAGAVGTMFFVSKIFDGVSDLLAGTLLDKTKTKWGKARPWLLWLAVPTGLALALIFWIPQDGSPMMQLIYAFVTYNLFTAVMYTMVGVAAGALMALMTQDGVERGTLATITTLFGLGGTLLGCSITFPFVYAMGGNVTAWRIVFAVYGAVTAVGSLLAFALTKENVESVESTMEVSDGKTVDKMSFPDRLKNFVSNKYFIFALAMTVIVNLAVQLNSSSQTYFYTYVMGDAMLTTTLNLAGLVPMVVGLLILVGPCLRKFGKKITAYIGTTGLIVGHVIRLAAASMVNVPLLAVGTVVGSLFSGMLSVPVSMLTSDAIDYGEYLTNKRIEGTGSAIVSFSQKISAGLSAGLVGWILSLTGYVANQVQTSTARFGIMFMFAWFPIILLVIVMICYRLIYKYDKEAPEVLAELQRRKENGGKKE